MCMLQEGLHLMWENGKGFWSPVAIGELMKATKTHNFTEVIYSHSGLCVDEHGICDFCMSDQLPILVIITFCIYVHKHFGLCCSFWDEALFHSLG